MRWEAARTSLSSGTRHRRCRCCLPALTGFTTGRRGETDAGHHDRENRRCYHMPSARPLTGPGAGICRRRTRPLAERVGLLGASRLAPVRGPREISLLAGRWPPAEHRKRNFLGCATGPPFGRYPRFVATAIGGLEATKHCEAHGGEGGIRTHEHPLRCYWNSSPAPSTARPPLRSITYDSPLERIEAEGSGPIRAAHDKP